MIRPLLAVGCQGYCVFLTLLLKQHNVKGRLDFLLAGGMVRNSFSCCGHCLILPSNFPCLTFKVGLRYLQPSQYTVHGSLHIVPHGLDARIDIDYRRIVFGRGTEQRFAFRSACVVILVDDKTGTLRLQPYISGNHLVCHYSDLFTSLRKDYTSVNWVAL